jgi:F-box protein 9
MNSEESNPELESFRQQWRAEVQARRAAPGPSRPQPQQQQQQRAAGPSTSAPVGRPATEPRGKPPQPSQKPVGTQETDEDYVQSQTFDEPTPSAAAASSLETAHSKAAEKGEPVSALDHYEKAVEKEAAGSLGDSLRLYRKAFRVS